MREGYFKDARVITGRNILTAKSRGRPRRSIMLPNLSVPCPAAQPRRLSAPRDRVCFFSVPALQPSQLPCAAAFASLEQRQARDLGHGGVRGRAAGCDGGGTGGVGASKLCRRQQAPSQLPSWGLGQILPSSLLQPLLWLERALLT